MSQSKTSFINSAANGALYAPLAALVAMALLGKAQDVPHLFTIMKALSLLLALGGIVLGALALIMARPFRLFNNGIGGLGLSTLVMIILLYYFLPPFIAGMHIRRLRDEVAGHWRSVPISSVADGQMDLTLNRDWTFSQESYPAKNAVPGMSGHWKIDEKSNIDFRVEKPLVGDVHGRQKDDQTIVVDTAGGGEEPYKRVP